MELNSLSVRALKPEYQTAVGFDLVIEKTKDNGIDEIFFEHQGTKYVAYNKDNLDISGVDKVQNEASWNGNAVRVIHTDDEVNHWGEKALNTSWNVISAAVPDAIGGAGAAAVVSKIGLGGKHMKLAVAAGALTSFFKEGISVAIADIASYGKTDWSSLERFSEPLSKSPAESTHSQTSVSEPASEKPVPSPSGSLLVNSKTQILGATGVMVLGAGRISVSNNP